MDGLVRTCPESFQHTLSDHEVSHLLGARKANTARADTMVGHFGDVWRHDALTRSPPCSLSLGARRRQILCSSLDRRCKNITLERCCFTDTFAMPAAVALSQCMGVGGWGWPSYLRVSRIMQPSLEFMKSAPSSASAAKDATNFILLHRV